MKKKILSIIGGSVFIALMVFNIQLVTNSNKGNLTLPMLAKLTNANAEGGTSGESCTSSTWCLPNYSEYVNWKGERFCCSSCNGTQGKAKA